MCVCGWLGCRWLDSFLSIVDRKLTSVLGVVLAGLDARSAQGTAERDVDGIHSAMHFINGISLADVCVCVCVCMGGYQHLALDRNTTSVRRAGLHMPSIHDLLLHRCTSP